MMKFLQFFTIFSLFPLLEALIIIVKPEAHRYQIRIYCGENRESLILEGIQKGVQNSYNRKDKQFVNVERSQMEEAHCVRDAKVVVDVLYFNKIQTSMSTTAELLNSMVKLVLGMPELELATKTFVLPPNPENGQIEVTCLKRDVGGPATQYVGDQSGTQVTLGRTWGRDSRVAIFGLENGDSELSSCLSEEVTLALRDEMSRAKWRIKMPMSHFMKSAQIEVADFWEGDLTNSVTVFTFDNDEERNRYQANGIGPRWNGAFSVLVYCSRPGQHDSLLIFGSGEQGSDGRAMVEMSRFREHKLKQCNERIFRVLIYRWNIVHANLSFDQFEEMIHVAVK